MRGTDTPASPLVKRTNQHPGSNIGPSMTRASKVVSFRPLNPTRFTRIFHGKLTRIQGLNIMPIVDPRTGEPLTPSGDAEQNTAPSQGQPSDAISSSMSTAAISSSCSRPPCRFPCCCAAGRPRRSPASSRSPCWRSSPGSTAALHPRQAQHRRQPDIAGQLGVQSVPDVKLVSQGGLVDQLQGAQPEQQVREWLGKYFQAPRVHSKRPKSRPPLP